MKRMLTLFLLLAIKASAQNVWTDHSRLLPDQLRGIPTAIEIFHNPKSVYPEPNTDTMNYPGKFIWKHSTTVSGKQELTDIAAGSYIWMGEKGWMANIKLDNAGFAARFKCPGGKLSPDKNYTFIKNWRYGNLIYAGDALWFVLAKDRAGHIYKGIELLKPKAN